MDMVKSSRTKRVGATEFKARCLELVEHVRESRAEYIVTRHGTPVARLVPVDAGPERVSLLGCMRDSVLGFERPLDAIDDEWAMDHDRGPETEQVRTRPGKVRRD
jgi:prevent-host-death family protein